MEGKVGEERCAVGIFNYYIGSGVYIHVIVVVRSDCYISRWSISVRYNATFVTVECYTENLRLYTCATLSRHCLSNSIRRCAMCCNAMQTGEVNGRTRIRSARYRPSAQLLIAEITQIDEQRELHFRLKPKKWPKVFTLMDSG